MTATTLAAVLTAYDEPLVVRELEIPEPRPGALIVQNLAATVCGTDVHIQHGDLAANSRLPLIPGHEVVGQVVATNGRDTDSLGHPLELGDVIAWAYAWCGECFWCSVAKQPTVCPHSRRYGWGPVDEFPHLTGGFARHSYVLPQCKIVKVPSGVDLALAAAATCSLRTVMHALERAGGVTEGEDVVVQGSGPVGLWATAVAARSGAGTVITIGAPENRLALADRWGATSTISVEHSDAAARLEQVRDLTHGRGAGLVLECSGASAAVGEAFQLARAGGRCAMVGAGSTGDIPVPAGLLVTKLLTVVGVRSGDISHYARALRFVASHVDLPLGELVGSRYSLGEVNDAYEAMRTMREIKGVVLPQRTGTASAGVTYP